MKTRQGGFSAQLCVVFSLLLLAVWPPDSAAYSTASSDPYERRYAYLLEAKDLIEKELDLTRGKQAPSDGFRAAVKRLVYECGELASAAQQGTQTLPPPDMSKIRQLCILPDPVSESTKKLQEVTVRLQTATRELNSVLQVRRGLERWLNTEFQRRVGGSIKKIVDILTSAGTSTLREFAKEVVGMTVEMIRADQPQFPDTSDFVRKHNAEIAAEMEKFITGLKSKYPDQDLASIQQRLQHGERLSRADQDFFQAVMLRSMVTATEVAGREIRKYQSSIIPQLQYEQKMVEKEQQQAQAQAKNIALYRGLCSELSKCQGWKQVTASPSLQLQVTALQFSMKPGTSVVYRYEVANAGNVQLSKIAIVDKRCSHIRGVSGDMNRNGILDQQERWIYECSAVVQVTTTSDVSATATTPSGGSVHASASVTVQVTTDLVAVPAVIGLEKATAEYDIQAARLKTGSIKTEISTQRAGVVIDQSPAAQTMVPPGTAVNLVIAAVAAPSVNMLYVDPKSKTLEVNDRVQLRAFLWFSDGHEKDVTALAVWQGADKGLFEARSAGDFQISASYGAMTGTATITVRQPLPPSWTPPISHADDIGRRTDPAPASAYTWYALCDKRTGAVTYGEHPDISQHVMGGPFEGPRTVKWWIDQKCPKWRCTSAGACASEPARGGNWNVLCDKQMGVIVLAMQYDYARHYPLQSGFLGEPDARSWTNSNCPSWRCDRDGRCIRTSTPSSSSPATPSGIDNCVNKYCPHCERSVNLLGVTVQECEDCKKRFAAQINSCRGQASAAVSQPPSGVQPTIQSPQPQTHQPSGVVQQWIVWHPCEAKGGWWCKLNLEKTTEERLSQRLKKKPIIFGKYATKQEAIRATCGSITLGNVWRGGQFAACSQLSHARGGVFCVGEFVRASGNGFVCKE